ncbi:RNase adapter RapZ [Nakamurella sp. YIM 132087]|uniref:RNase adapter RapZ n=1 Tax=Nakamurella alba TaxID=2665158 RepID=A0A7K1FL44_9ACTN|nr:RNase adapter RapZ [Nakamurella alba]
MSPVPPEAVPSGPGQDPGTRSVADPDVGAGEHADGGRATGDRTDLTGIEVAIVSGLSGAGRSTAAKCLEDSGWFVVDNLPPNLIATMVDLGAGASGRVTRMAVVLDVRSRAFTEDLASVIKDLDARGYRPRLLFLEASDATLIRRYEANRREHPLQGGGRLVDGLAAERTLLEGLRREADVIIDTSNLSVHQLRAEIERSFAEGPRRSSLTVLSFGYKYGLPLDADLVVDMRFLPNPFWIPELRDLTGRDPAVRDYVLSQEGAAEFLDRYTGLLDLVGGGFRREGKRYLTLAVGCTGGKHRSVAVAEELARRLGSDTLSVRVAHRDLGRE